MKRAAKTIVLLLVACAACASAFASSLFTDNVDRSDPNFVKASLLVTGPGDALYSCAGHSFFRLECPVYNLDCCFSFESEDVSARVLTFLLGKLKMGLLAVPTDAFLRQYAVEGRGVVQYSLNLPPEVKQRLWKVLDEKAAASSKLPYDYIEHGCAQSLLRYLSEAIQPLRMDVPPWPAKYEKTQRELFADALVDSPWNLFMLHVLVGTAVDAELPKMRRVIIPADLVEFLKTVKVAGVPIISGDPVVIQQRTNNSPTAWLTPVMASVIALSLAVVNVFLRCRWIDWGFLLLQAALGLFLFYLIFVSTLPATGWNWLFVPFNPLPLMLWRWRRQVAIAFGGLIVVWEAFMAFSPHQLTHPAFLILAFAYAVLFFKIATVSLTETKTKGIQQ